MTRHVTSSVHAEHPLPIKLVELLALGWPFTILKALNPIDQPARSEKKSLYPTRLNTGSSACRSLCQNPYDGKDELAGGTPTDCSNRRTPAPVATCAFTSAAAIVLAPLIASGSADSFAVRYSEDDLQLIVKTVLDFRPSALVPAPVVVSAPHYKGSRERPLKAWFPDIFRGKTHLECYNFFQQCKDHFVTVGGTRPNRVPFAATFLKNTALFHW